HTTPAVPPTLRGRRRCGVRTVLPFPRCLQAHRELELPAPVGGQSDDLDVAARAGRVHHLVVTGVEAVVAHTGEEHDVAGLQSAHVGDALAHLSLRVGGAGQVHAGRTPGSLHQTGAVVALGTGTAL